MKAIVFFFLIIGFSASAQFTPPSAVKTEKSFFDRHLLVGFAANNSWATYRDLVDDSAFYRPSLGMGLRVDYFFKPFIGISAGFGIQHRGMGVYTNDVDNSIGNPDSTGRLRYRTTTFDIPVQLILRTPKNIFASTRLSLALGVDFSYVFKAQRIWKSVDDGFHIPTIITEQYDKWDIPLRVGFGLDVEAGSGCLFRAHLFGEMSRKYLYANPVSGVRSNQNMLLGIDLSFMF
jgi:hypothetical protein